jgi:UDP-2,3-diacylglucosamine pyrophosphatase LpxH
MRRKHKRSPSAKFLAGMAVGAGAMLLRDAIARKNPDYTFQQILVNMALDKGLQRARLSNRRNLSVADRYIIFSDHHKGVRDRADDFRQCEDTYLRALDYYHAAGYNLILLGDAEELWEQDAASVLDAYKNVLESEARFYPSRYLKIAGNHDDPWDSPDIVDQFLSPFFPGINVHQNLVLDVHEDGESMGELFLIHGHQGTIGSDTLNFLGPFFLPYYRWLQNLTHIGRTSPSKDACLRANHDTRMYRWSSKQEGVILIAGHTHRPVWSSRTHLEKLLWQLFTLQEKQDEIPPEAYEIAVRQLQAGIQKLQEEYPPCDDTIKTRPSYFNTGCCRFEDGDITGIELVDGKIRLIKWVSAASEQQPIVLEEMKLSEVFALL